MTRDLAIPERIKGQAELDRLAPQITAHREYTYRVFHDFALGNVDLTQSIFTGSLWREIRSNHTCFQRCDFDGMQIERCQFTNVDFRDTDIRSTIFAGCQFLECRFDGALIDSCSFDQCAFDRCTFESTVQRALQFSDCDLRGYSLARSSFTKCRIDRSRMRGLTLADCTFLYIILRGCELDDVTVNVESLGTVFGLSREDLGRLKFIHLGHEALPVQVRDLAAVLATTFEGKGWTLSLSISRINFELTSTAFAFAEYLRDVEAQLESGRRLRHEEISFVLEVFDCLFDDGRLPLVSLSQIGSVLQRAQSSGQGAAAEKRLTNETLDGLTARTSALAQRTLDRLAGAIAISDGDDARIVSIECQYAEAPRMDIPQLLIQAEKIAGLTPSRLPQRIAVRRGSYIEVIEASLTTVFAFQVLLYALNGTLIQLTEMKERIRVLRQQRAPRKFELLARSDQQALPAALRQPIRKLLDFAFSGSWMHTPDLDGIDSRNLRQVTLDELPLPDRQDELPPSPTDTI